MEPKRYRVLIADGLWYPTDPVVLRRLRAGDNMPMRARRLYHAAQGEIVSDVPPASIPGLLRTGRIEEVSDVQEI